MNAPERCTFYMLKRRNRFIVVVVSALILKISCMSCCQQYKSTKYSSRICETYTWYNAVHISLNKRLITRRNVLSGWWMNSTVPNGSVHAYHIYKFLHIIYICIISIISIFVIMKELLILYSYFFIRTTSRTYVR